MSLRIAFILAALAGLSALTTACGDPRGSTDAPPMRKDDTALIPRELVFADPQRTSVKISPDAQRIAWIENGQDGSQLWSALVSAPDTAAAIARTPDGHVITHFLWAGNNTTIAFTAVSPDDETQIARSVNVLTRAERVLFAQPGSRARLLSASLDFPNEVVIALNSRDKGLFDLYRMNVASAAKRRIYENADGFVEFVIDANLVLRLGHRPLPDGGAEVLVRDAAAAPWRPFLRWSPEDAQSSRLLAFDEAETGVYALDTTNRETRALVRIEIATGRREVIGAVPGADVDAVLLHPATNALDGFGVERLRRAWRATSPLGGEALAQIEDAVGPEFIVTSRSLDDRMWTFVTKDATGQHFILDRQSGTLTPLFASYERGWVGGVRKPVIIDSLDGLALVAYLTLPPGADASGDGVPDKPLPLVIRLHEGPWSRHYAAFDRADAWLADRGYAVMSLNPRGSRGFGKTYLNAGAGAWGAGVTRDIDAAAAWTIDHGVADPDRIGLWGVFLGGHAGLAAMARTPETYQCAVAVNPPSDLAALVEDTPARYAPLAPMVSWMIGDVSDAQVRGVLGAQRLSVLAASLTDPVLVIQGDHDPMDQNQRTRIDALEAVKAGAPMSILAVTQRPAPDGRRPGRLIAAAAIEHFFASCLGGRAEPIPTRLSPAWAHIEHDAGALAQIANALDKSD